MVQLMEDALLPDHILRLSSSQISQRRLDVAITVLLLQESGRDVSLAYEGLRRGRYRLDHRFVVELLGSAPKKVQWAIVRSPAFWHLPKRVYQHHFFRFWKLHRRAHSWRWVLGRSLHPFLMENPREGPLYAEPIWTMATDPDEGISLAGLNNAQFLGSALTLEQAERLVALTRHASARAIAAKSSIGSLYKDFSNLRPDVRALLLRRDTLATLRIRHPSDSRHRLSAHNWCLTNMRKVLRRATSRPGLPTRKRHRHANTR